MNERELLKRIIDFSFIIKAQLYSDETALLRSILNVVIMEAEDVVELIDEKTSASHGEMSERTG